jgi:6-pyruvoyltetrahydropterin/6-carboxytetrahydropterin synthase
MDKNMKMYISREFRFDAAHNLINYNGKCENLHGHTYKLKVTLSGSSEKDSGMIVDFTLLKKIVNEKVIDKLDHNYLNNVLEQSTAENTIEWIWEQLREGLKGGNYELYELTLWETETSSVTLRKE